MYGFGRSTSRQNCTVRYRAFLGDSWSTIWRRSQLLRYNYKSRRELKRLCPRNAINGYQSQRVRSILGSILESQVDNMKIDTIHPEGLPLQFVKTIRREEVTYDLYTKSCSCCGKLTYLIGRADGARISCFQISEESSENVDKFIDEIHESFAIDIKALIGCLQTTMEEITSKDDYPRFLTERLSVYRIRTLDRARLIMSRFSAEGKLDRLVTSADIIDDDLVAAAFFFRC
jgi:hypothetical protein